MSPTSVDLEHAPTLETAAAMSPALQASLSPRVDLELQKLAQWPRLLASRIERRTLKGLFELGLEDMMLEAIRSDARILSMAVAFEPVWARCLSRLRHRNMACGWLGNS